MSEKSNVEILDELGELGDIRQRLGAKDESDASRDHRINKMSATEIVRTYAGWHLGDGSWGGQILGLYKELIRRDVADEGD
jgi:hypothetical protein